jgi:hypothetical protein
MQHAACPRNGTGLKPVRALQGGIQCLCFVDEHYMNNLREQAA